MAGRARRARRALRPALDRRGAGVPARRAARGAARRPPRALYPRARAIRARTAPASLRSGHRLPLDPEERAARARERRAAPRGLRTSARTRGGVAPGQRARPSARAAHLALLAQPRAGALSRGARAGAQCAAARRPGRAAEDARGAGVGSRPAADPSGQQPHHSAQALECGRLRGRRPRAGRAGGTRASGLRPGVGRARIRGVDRGRLGRVGPPRAADAHVRRPGGAVRTLARPHRQRQWPAPHRFAVGDAGRADPRTHRPDRERSLHRDAVAHAARPGRLQPLQARLCRRPLHASGRAGGRRGGGTRAAGDSRVRVVVPRARGGR